MIPRLAIDPPTVLTEGNTQVNLSYVTPPITMIGQISIVHQHLEDFKRVEASWPPPWYPH